MRLCLHMPRPRECLYDVCTYGTELILILDKRSLPFRSPSLHVRVPRRVMAPSSQGSLHWNFGGVSRFPGLAKETMIDSQSVPVCSSPDRQGMRVWFYSRGYPAAEGSANWNNFLVRLVSIRNINDEEAFLWNWFREEIAWGH
jgi:hypothetical protein